MSMKLSPPTQVVFGISIVLAIIAVMSMFVRIAQVTPNAFWVLFVAYLILVIGCLFRGR